MLQLSEKTGVLAMLLAAVLLAGSATTAQADQNCQKKILKAERNLEIAMQRHGVYSKQAARRRAQLQRVQACH